MEIDGDMEIGAAIIVAGNGSDLLLLLKVLPGIEWVIVLRMPGAPDGAGK